jgi:hypothetical protein
MNIIFFVSLVVANSDYALFIGEQSISVYCVARDKEQAISMVLGDKRAIGDILCHDQGRVSLPLGVLSYTSYAEAV